MKLFKSPSLPLALLLCATLSPASLRAETVTFTGITEPINDVTLSSPAAGIIGRRAVNEGDFVKQGQVLVELDRRLEELEVDRRKSILDLQKTELDSTTSLREKNSISVSREEVNKKQSEYNVAAAEYDLAKEQLKRRQIVSPFEGTVADIFLKAGEACQLQQPVVRVVDTRRCYFISNIDARNGHNLVPGQKVRLELEAGGTPAPLSGTIYFISPVADPASGLMKIKVVFDNPEGKVRPGVAGKMLLEESK